MPSKPEGSNRGIAKSRHVQPVPCTGLKRPKLFGAVGDYRTDARSMQHQFPILTPDEALPSRWQALPRPSQSSARVMRSPLRSRLESTGVTFRRSVSVASSTDISFYDSRLSSQEQLTRYGWYSIGPVRKDGLENSRKFRCTPVSQVLPLPSCIRPVASNCRSRIFGRSPSAGPDRRADA